MSDPLETLPTIATLLVGGIVGAAMMWLWHLAWRLRHTRNVRDDAVRRSLAVTSGKVHEQLAPFLPDFDFNPKDARFLGSPIDFVVFDGLSDGSVRRVVFVEVKTGGSALTVRERQVRDAIESGAVEWSTIRIASTAAAAAAIQRV